MMRCVRAGIGLSQVARPLVKGGTDQVLVRVKYAGVNRPELLQHKGLYPARPGVTDILGLELAGVIEETGEEVCALTNGGAYADYCVVNKLHMFPLPFSGDDRFQKSSALPETVITVWKNLFYNGPDSLKGKSVFIHGGSSGIGTTAIALAKAFNASLVQTTAGSEEKCKFCTSTVGADVAFNYRDVDWSKVAEKADVVLDIVGGDYFQKNINLLRDGGRLVMIGFLGGPSSKVNFSRVLLKNLTLTGSVLRSAPDEVKNQICAQVKEHVWDRINDGEINLPYLSHTFDLEDFEKAYATMETSKHSGKITLTL